MENITNHKLNFKIFHRNWEQALAMAFALLIAAEPGELVCIVGPSRAGKTKLIEELTKLLLGENPKLAPGQKPVVSVDVENKGSDGRFSSRNFTLELLEAVHHPLTTAASEELGISFYQKIERLTESSLRSMAEKALIARGVKYLFFDEAQHVKYATKAALGAYAVMDSWKCLAKTANLVLVVVGAYPVLDILQKSPHLLGRKHQVHLPRYQLCEEDLLEFSAIVSSYEEKLNICMSMGTLNNCIDILYKYSFGCIGLLRGWLVRADAMASIRKTGITKAILLSTRLSDSDLENIHQEILIGENILLKSDIVKNSVQSVSAPLKSKRKGKPFRRLAKRLTPGNRDGDTK